ncbi:Major facilitator superfamily domain-containing protein 6 [Armadillidium vulgare]|nr:Major facilitator superfamily domain-containing protein 6 [Armadillidium vulgare]
MFFPSMSSCSESLGAHLRVAPPYICEPELGIDLFSIKIEGCTVSCYHTEEMKNLKSLTILEDSNLSCKNSTNCFDEDELLLNSDLSNSSVYREAAYINDPIYYMNVIIKRLNRTLTNETYESNEFLCPNLDKNGKLGDNCVTRCSATALREEVCRNNVSTEILNPSLTFYSHLAIRVLNEFTISSNGAAVTIIKEHKGDFGFQRMFANLGMMTVTPISGLLMDYFSVLNGFEDFRPAMYVYCFLKLLAALIILFLNLDFKQASNKVISDFSTLLLNPEVICFLMATFLAGTCYGYIETFLFWLLQDLGADKRLMGLTLTVGCIFGIPLLMISTFILKKIGHVNTMVIGFFVYVVRLMGYTFISNPWWAMPFEAMECATVSLMVVSFMSYASDLATPSTIVTLQSIYGGLYNGVGRGAGSLIGGFLIHRLGIFNAFRIIACLAGCLRKNRRQRDEIVLQEKEARKAKEAEANKQIVDTNKQPVELVNGIKYEKKESLKESRIEVPTSEREKPDDLSKTNLGFIADNMCFKLVYSFVKRFYIYSSKNIA